MGVATWKAIDGGTMADFIEEGDESLQELVSVTEFDELAEREADVAEMIAIFSKRKADQE